MATAGLPVGKGLSKKAAAELGLIEGTPVGSAVIDAYVEAFACIDANSCRTVMQGGLEPSLPATLKMESFPSMSLQSTSPGTVLRHVREPAPVT